MPITKLSTLTLRELLRKLWIDGPKTDMETELYNRLNDIVERRD